MIIRRLLTGSAVAVLFAAMCVPIVVDGQPTTSMAERFRFLLTGCVLSSGSGSPESARLGSPCDFYIRSDSPYTHYRKESGTATNTGWVALGGSGTVTSVAMTVPTGLSVSGSPVTSSGTLAVSLTSGYMIPGGGTSGHVLTSQGASAPIFAAQASGGLILIEKKLVTSASTTVTFSGLDGDTDEVYVLMGRFVVPSGGSDPHFSWQPNGVTTNQDSQRGYHDGTGTAADGYAILTLVNSSAVGSVSMFEITIHAKKNPNGVAVKRQYSGTYGAYHSYSASMVSGVISGQWAETSTNITSIVINSSVASKIGDGSTFALYRYAQ